MLEGELKLLVDRVLLYHGSKPLRSFRDYDESSFQTAIELILSSNLYISEMRLIVEYTKKNTFKYGFIDMFLLDDFFCAIIELKLFNLVGLYCGKLGAWKKNPDFKELAELNEELKTDTEEELIQRNYMYWSKDDSCYKTITVKKYIDDGVKQLNKYINVVSKGNAQIKKESVGILDPRIRFESGVSYLSGVLIVSLGSQRIITRKVKMKKIYYKFVIENKFV